MIDPVQENYFITRMKKLAEEDVKIKAIFKSHFKNGPWRRLKYPLIRYNLGRKKVLDVGCGWGQNLIYFGKGSVGIDCSDEAINFINRIGCNAEKRNFEEPLSLSCSDFDIIWCSNVVEHLFSPHRFLIEMRKYLKEDGTLIISVPIVPNFIVENIFKIIFRYFFNNSRMPYLALDHVNAFTVKTFNFLLKRAGYEVIEKETFNFNPFLSKLINPIVVNNWHTVFWVVRKKIGWDYPNKSLKVLDEEGNIKFK